MLFRTFAALIVAVVTSWPARAVEPIQIGSRLEPFVDDFLIETTSGVALTLQKPTPREVVFVHEKPWEGNITAHHTVFRDGDRYRMYYGGRHYDAQNPKVRHPVICYAESKDGVHWTRPNLELFDYEGSKQNNIVWMGDVWAKSETRDPMAIFRDLNPHCSPEAKYKSIARGDDGVNVSARHPWSSGSRSQGRRSATCTP